MQPLCAYGSCYETKHSSGWLSTHQWVSYADSRKGWQTVPGRTPKDPPYYFNASTGTTRGLCT